MNIVILTLFPEVISESLNFSIIKRAKQKNLVAIKTVNIRDFAHDKHKSVDDRPYGGGAGMILRVDVVDKAIQSVKQNLTGSAKTILLDPQGTVYTQKLARTFGTIQNLILICGHYEGVDERIRSLVDMEVSIGDIVLTGGEIPALVVVDSVVRLLPGVLSKTQATIDESFTNGLLEYPHYTRPEVYKNMNVPEVLLSGNHSAIVQWRREQAQARTRTRRPDLVTSNEKTDRL